MTYTDGNTYQGNFIDGLKHGIGKMVIFMKEIG
jgi:hypothetical protein